MERNLSNCKKQQKTESESYALSDDKIQVLIRGRVEYVESQDANGEK